MNRDSLRFAMARYGHEDIVLREIAQQSLNFLFRCVDTGKIRCILLTGSVANGEGTVIEHNSSMITSDFDFVIYMDFPHFLKNRTHFQNLSQQMSTRLREKGVNTHVTFLLSMGALHKGIFPVISNIYQYEFALASRCIFGKTPSFNPAARPSKRDALELTFTVISDLVFLKLKAPSKIEESYIYAKRALTLLNSILIFHGFFAETYQKRMEIARKYAAIGRIPLNQDEIKTLEIFTEYKLSGSFQQLAASLARKKTDDLIRFQKKFLRKLTTKILYYELNYILNKATQTKLEHSNSLQNMSCRFPALLREYSKYSRTRPLSRVMGITLCLFWSLARNRRRRELFNAFIFHKQSPKVILNVILALLFIYDRDISARKILREFFPWITVNDETEAIQRTFSLWQIAEQSIKL